MPRRLPILFVLLPILLVPAANADVPLPDEAHSRMWTPPTALRRVGPLRTSAGTTPDSVWIGHSYTDHWSATHNYWNVYAGDRLPGTSLPQNAVWDWDHLTGFGPGTPANANDTLAGWWPMRRSYGVTGGLTLPDASRPWWALDWGNAVNYRLNSGRARTKGVIGVWHHDPGRHAGSRVTWTPISGGKSAWCGLRVHGDVSVMDPITGNPYNASTHEFVGTNGGITGVSVGTSKNWPGYSNSWDQMLYRDVAIAAHAPLTVSFRYRTRMGTYRDALPSTQTGWFHGDPLSVTPGNFISATDAGANAPVDSFLVYVGVPADAAACTYSDGVTRAVYDPLRRWFSEVIRVFGPGNTYFRVFAASGATDTLLAAPTASVTLDAVAVNALLAAQGGGASGTARLVFRVKTNKDQSDADRISAFTSSGWGAAQVDEVTVGGVVIGSFEGNETAGVPGTPMADAPIDNAATTTALTNWKSTGKPPAVHWHARTLAELRYEDLCGPPGAATRLCNMSGVVISAGNFDDGESAGDTRFAVDRERMDGIVSPTVCFANAGAANPKEPNAMGIYYDIANPYAVGDDYFLVYDVYTGGLDLEFTGNSWTFGAQCYPARQANGAIGWGELRVSPLSLFDRESRCVEDFQGLAQNGLIVTSKGSILFRDNAPDSLRIFLGKTQQCFRFALSLCNTTDGAYFDNVSLLLSLYATSASLAPLRSDIGNFWQDAFPANETAGLPGTAAFDTTAALLRSGLNGAPGHTVPGERFDVLGDTVLVSSSPVGFGGSPYRIDMVFRILPGPGNYQIAAGRSFPPTDGGASSNVLLREPTNQSQPAMAGDGSFWGAYLADPGPYGTPGGHQGGTKWDHLTWNSARCDTAERNVFPVSGKISANVGGVFFDQWASMLHESDPRYTTLGVVKFRCFLNDTTLTAQMFNLNCGGDGPGYVNGAPAYLSLVPGSRTGYDGVPTTREYTKIIPDGLLTPGSHVQYFWRYQRTGEPSFWLLPDTSTIVPQSGEGSRDGHRWQHVSVLPDRWKDFPGGGAGMACMLVVDQADRGGEERSFISIADSIGLSLSSRIGAFNGWSAMGTDNVWEVYDPTPPFFRYGNQPAGSLFDLYNVKAGESPSSSGGNLGNRLSPRTPGTLLDGKWARTGPTPEMLRTYYRMILLLTGGLSSSIGPAAQNGANDVALLQDFLAGASGMPQPRGLWVLGGNFVAGELAVANSLPAHGVFVREWLGVDLLAESFRGYTGYALPNVELRTTTSTSATDRVYGHASDCGVSDDVLALSGLVPEAVVGTRYGQSPGLVAGVHKPHSEARPWVDLVDGFTLDDLTTRFGDYTRERHGYVLDVLATAFASVGCAPSGPILDSPAYSPRRVLDAVALFGNPVRGPYATLRLSLSAPDRVRVRVFDPAGRLVRTLVDRPFTAGEHDVRWDGADDAGRRLARGVYFAQALYLGRGFAGARKVMLLK